TLSLHDALPIYGREQPPHERRDWKHGAIAPSKRCTGTLRRDFARVGAYARHRTVSADSILERRDFRARQQPPAADGERPDRDRPDLHAHEFQDARAER